MDERELMAFEAHDALERLEDGKSTNTSGDANLVRGYILKLLEERDGAEALLSQMQEGS